MTSFLRSLFDVMASSSSETLIIYSFVALGIVTLTTMLSTVYQNDTSLSGNYHMYAKAIILMTTFLMVVYITLLAITYATKSQSIEGTVEDYQYHADKSEITLQIDDKEKSYSVIGVANTFQYQKGDTIQASLDENYIYNVAEINDHNIKSPLSKLHVVFLLLMLTTIGVGFNILVYAWVHRSKHEGVRNTFKEIYDVISLVASIGMLIIVFAVVAGQSTDNRVVHIKGDIVEHIDHEHFVVEDEHSSIRYIIKDDEKHKDYLDAEINQVSHQIVEEFKDK